MEFEPYFLHLEPSSSIAFQFLKKQTESLVLFFKCIEAESSGHMCTSLKEAKSHSLIILEGKFDCFMYDLKNSHKTISFLQDISLTLDKKNRN